MGNDVTLRPAEGQDIDALFEWRCDPEIYQWFRNQDEELEWDGHVNWFMNRPDDREDLMIEYGGGPVGVVAIASDGDVGIYIGEKDLWGQGIATDALTKAVDDRDRQLSAQIHVENTSSQKLFERVGFEECGQEDEWILYEY